MDTKVTANGGLHRYFLGSAPNPGDRPQILVSHADADRINNLPHGLCDATATVYDHNSKKPMLIRRASCGLRCICALEVVGI